VSIAPSPCAGRAAGIVTRLLAAAIDLLTVLLMMGGVFVGVAAVRFLVSPLSFRWPVPSSVLSVVIGMVLAVGYLTVGWATVGRTGGAAVLGLRVLSIGRSRLGWARAVLRAVLCVVFPVGLLWSAVSRERRSLQDLVVRSVVVYDWHRSPAEGTDSAQRLAR
jgi:uncharacterized RDD family membrane protein YckC